jgi:vacuolar protein sorting-associated protein 13A/C
MGGILNGIVGFGMSIASGFKGVVEKPITGFNQDGVSGMVMGLGKGVTGIITKPLGGLVGLISNTIDTIGNKISL